jgi:hypothetical protein
MLHRRTYITQTDNEPTGFIWRRKKVKPSSGRRENTLNDVNTVKAKNILKEENENLM